MTHLRCQGSAGEGNAQVLLRRAARGPPPVCRPLGLHAPGFLHAPEARQPDVDAEPHVARVASKPDAPQPQQRQQAVEGLARPWALRPVRRRPPPPRTPARAAAAPLCHRRLAPGGSHPAWRAPLPTLWTPAAAPREAEGASERTTPCAAPGAGPDPSRGSPPARGGAGGAPRPPGWSLGGGTVSGRRCAGAAPGAAPAAETSGGAHAPGVGPPAPAASPGAARPLCPASPRPGPGAEPPARSPGRAGGPRPPGGPPGRSTGPWRGPCRCRGRRGPGPGPAGGGATRAAGRLARAAPPGVPPRRRPLAPGPLRRPPGPRSAGAGPRAAAGCSPAVGGGAGWGRGTCRERRGGILAPQPLSQGETCPPPRQPRLRAGGQGGRRKPVQRIPEALPAPRRGGRGPPPGQDRALGPRGDGPRACGPGRTGARRQAAGGAHRQRGAPPWRGGGNGGLAQRKAPQVWRPGSAPGRGPNLPRLPRVARGPGPAGSRGSPRATAWRHAPLRRPQIARLAHARGALAAGGADPVKLRSAFLPLGNQAGQSARGIRLALPVQKHVAKRSAD